MMRPRPDKRPKRTAGFSWGRITGPTGWTEYRLFRRAGGRLLPPQSLFVAPTEDRKAVAKALLIVKRRLLDRATEVELQAMGIEA